MGRNWGTISGKCINNSNISGFNIVGGNVGCNERIISGECINNGIVKGKVKECINGNVGLYRGTILGHCTDNGRVIILDWLDTL